jgi:large subunit ribosomal protein L40
MRTRHVAPPSPEVLEARAAMLIEWTKHKGEEAIRDQLWVEKAMAAQEHALAELRAESEELYQAAIQVRQSKLSRHIKD